MMQQWVEVTGPYAIVLLFFASVLEYVFPPFPGDTVTVVGAYYAVVDVQPLFLIFLAVIGGNLVGSAIDYGAGVLLRRWRPRRLSLERLSAIEETWKRKGDWLIVANRFLPGVRGLFFVAAGLSGMPFARVMMLGALSSALWSSALLALGFVLGANLPTLLGWVRAYGVVAWGVVAVAAAIFLARWLLRRRLRPSAR